MAPWEPPLDLPCQMYFLTSIMWCPSTTTYSLNPSSTEFNIKISMANINVSSILEHVLGEIYEHAHKLTHSLLHSDQKSVSTQHKG